MQSNSRAAVMVSVADSEQTDGHRTGLPIRAGAGSPILDTLIATSEGYHCLYRYWHAAALDSDTVPNGTCSAYGVASSQNQLQMVLGAASVGCCHVYVRSCQYSFSAALCILTNRILDDMFRETDAVWKV